MPPKEAATSLGDSFCQRAERLGSGLVGRGVDDWGAGIAALPNDGVEGDLSEQRYPISETGAQRCGHFVATAVAVRRGRSLCFCEVTVADAEGAVIAKGLAVHRFG